VFLTLTGSEYDFGPEIGKGSYVTIDKQLNMSILYVLGAGIEM